MIPERPQRAATRLVWLLPIVLIPSLVLILGLGFLPFLLFPAVMLAPAFLVRDDESSPGGADVDDSGGHGPPQPGPSHDAPQGGIPLPDADPARRRVRDHDRPVRVSPRRRRTAREPADAPTRAPGGR
jgi:hypothetical protein